MSKFYAVKKGRIPGIYNSWPECQKQVTGFSGAVYKSFVTLREAEEFMGLVTKPQINLGLEEVHIYTDGSHIKGTLKLGIGAYSDYGGQEYFMSWDLDADYLKEWGITGQVSNPTAEFIAFCQTLLFFVDRKLKPVKLVFHIDYEGIKNWVDGTWQAKEPHIKQMKINADNLVSRLSVPFEIRWVPGHSGVVGNDRADEMAKARKNETNFWNLVSLLQN